MASNQQAPSPPPPPPSPPSSPGRNNVFQVGSLFLTDIPPDVTEIDLVSTFSQVGTLLSVRLLRDRTTQRLLGTGYVNYERQEDAARALVRFNYALGNANRPIRIMWAMRQTEEARRALAPANLFIGNLSPAIDSCSLHQVFAHFGQVLSCVVADADPTTGHSKGYGFVQFTEADDAASAIAALNGKRMNGRKVYVGPFIPKNERVAQGDTSQKSNCTILYVKNLPEELRQEYALGAFFQNRGHTVEKLTLPMDDAGQAKGFAYVKFASSELAEAACMALNGAVVSRAADGSEICLYVAKLRRKSEREEEKRRRREQQKEAKRAERSNLVKTNLYVKNLDLSVDDGRLKDAFAAFGTITSAKVALTEPTKAGINLEGTALQPQSTEPVRSKGFGFVAFSQPEAAAKAKVELDGKIIDHVSAAGKPLYVNYAQPKAEREAWKVRMRYGGSLAPAGVIHSPPTEELLPSMMPLFGGLERIPMPYLVESMAWEIVMLNRGPLAVPNLGPGLVRVYDGEGRPVGPSPVEQGLLPPGFSMNAQGQIVRGDEVASPVVIESQQVVGTYTVANAPVASPSPPAP